MRSDTPPADKAARVRTMFARIVPRYDLMNRLMTGGMDRGWRKTAARMCRPEGAKVLDIATGTADLALELLRQGAGQVVGVDFCGPMLDEAARKTAGKDYALRLVAGDAHALPFGDESFDRVTNGFLLRNVSDLDVTFREMHRVLRPGGLAVSLEITHPPSRAFSTLFQPFFYRFVPLLGAAISGDRQAYSYLPNSLTRFPTAPRLAARMMEAGFPRVTYRYLSFGAVAVHVAEKGFPE